MYPSAEYKIKFKEYFSRYADKAEIVENAYNLSVSTYVGKEDTREIIGIKVLNKEIEKTVRKMDKVRSSMNEVVKEFEGELDKNSTCRDFRQVRKEGNRNVSRDIPFYNLDMIISLGYRVKSKIATDFRKWEINIESIYTNVWKKTIVILEDIKYGNV